MDCKDAVYTPLHREKAANSVGGIYLKYEADLKVGRKPSIFMEMLDHEVMNMANSKVDPNPPQSENGFESRHAEFEALSKELAESELELATLENKLSEFEKRYARTVGILFAELDELEKEIAKELLRLNPTEEYKQGFQRAERKAKNSQDAVNERIVQNEKKPFTPSDELKNLFRKVAKIIHPDLATDEHERAYRNSLMARANEAYKNGDLEALEQILDEWEHRDEKTFSKEAQPSQLDQLEQKILQVRTRINAIERRIAELGKSELYQLMIKVEQAELEGRDLLGDMAKNLQDQIQAAKGLLESLREKG
jgi:hypothetical protein